MGEIKALSESEELVMAIVWSSDEVPDMKTVSQIAAGRYGKNWKSQTVSTFLSRLVKKGYLRMERRGKGIYYIPLIRWADYCEGKIRRMADLFFNGCLIELGYFAQRI